MLKRKKINNDLGHLLRTTRLKRNLTLKDVAQATQKHLQTIWDIENGQRGLQKADPVFVQKLADYLNLPVSLILEKAESRYSLSDGKYKEYIGFIKNKSVAQTLASRMATLHTLIDALLLDVSSMPDIRKTAENIQLTVKEIDAVMLAG